MSIWLPIYRTICKDFGYSEEKDMESAKLLASLLGDKGKRSIEKVHPLFPQTVTVCGGGRCLADEVSSMKFEGYVVAADSATSTLLEAGILPNMIVTDLDGIVEEQIEANARGCAIFVHAHGDNMDAVRKYVPKFVEPVVGTCQCPPVDGVFNFGGFTDGDRAACICAALGARRVLLAGFDFDAPTEKPGKDSEVKRRKLRWAKVVLDKLAIEGVRVAKVSGCDDIFG
jgi:uncharacterized Rossmann fold enzyme